nr:MAG TPA: hypothetical protein [Caudoviricetes sp.]
MAQTAIVCLIICYIMITCEYQGKNTWYFLF